MNSKKCIEIKLTALSPLAIGKEKPGGSISEVEKYIPGSVLRGAVAKEILRRYPEIEMQNLDVADNNDFRQIFLGENPAIFQNLYPAIAKGSNGYEEVKNTAIKVLPATAVSSKANPGFITSKKHGAFDTLIDWFCANKFDHPYDPSSINAIVDGVDSRVEAYSCFYTKLGNKYRSHAVTSRLLTRVGINRRRATAAENILYSIEVLNEEFQTNTNQWENYIYHGNIVILNEGLRNKLIKFFNQNSSRFSLGGSTSRGLGKVKIEARESQMLNNVKSRIETFNSKLKTRYQKWSDAFGQNTNNPFSNNRQYFTINLHSEAILVENWQRTTVISVDMLKQVLSVDDNDASLELHAAYSSYDYRSGWNSAWGLMKDVELVTSKGSVYLFSVITKKINFWYEALFNLELNAIGERTTEGFGRVEICNDFHLVFREDAV